MVDKTMSFVFGEVRFKTIGIGRTDAKVSANSYYIQLFVDDVLMDENSFIKSLNANFSPDFRAVSMRQVDRGFNIIQAAKVKEYHYYFSFGEKNHHFASPFIVNVSEKLNIDEMMKAARLF
jgi:tRNA pseudouridine38-40 synthase